MSVQEYIADMSNMLKPLTGTRGPAMKANPEDWLNDADAIVAFCRERGVELASGTPLARWIRNLKNVAAQTQLEGHPTTIASNDQTAALHDVYGARLLAWSIHVLKEHHASVKIDASLVRDELAGADHTEGNSKVAMPGGVGALFVAAQCMSLHGGRIHVAGNTSKGSSRPDIRWETTRGGIVIVERKDRAFFRAASETADELERSLVSRAQAATTQLPTNRGDAIVLPMVGAVTALETASLIAPRIGARAADAFRTTHARTGTSPDGAIFALLGYQKSPLRAVNLSSTTQFKESDHRTENAWAGVRDVFGAVP